MQRTTEDHSIFDLLLSRHFESSHVKVQWNPQKRNLPTTLTKKMDNFWKQEIEQTSRASYIFNGDLCRLNSWQVDGNHLLLNLGYTNYKELLFTNHCHETGENTLLPEQASNALGISVVLISKDDELVLINRTETVGESPGKICVVGGHIHPTEHAVSEIPNVFYAMQMEIKEEVNLDLGEESEMTCIGLFVTKKTKKPELIFRAAYPKTANEIIKDARTIESLEISNYLTVPNDAAGINSFLRSKKDDMTPCAFGTLSLYSQQLQNQ